MNIFDVSNSTQKSIHFIGIAGAGMAPLACIIKDKGFVVSGSDEKDSYIVEKLLSKGIKVYIGHKESNIGDVDYVVYSAAIKKDNPELKIAKEKNIMIIQRSKLLGDFTKQFSKLVAVSGSHGKTTTSSMISEILIGAGKDPTSIIGGENKENDKSCRSGNSEFAICEACEFMDSFLYIEASIGVILNIDDDHLDYFGTLEEEKKSFKKFAKKCKKILIINAENYNALEVVSSLTTINKVFYGIKNKENFKDLDFYAQNLNFDLSGLAEFEIISKNSKQKTKIKLKVPGIHNVSNALAAIAACECLGIDISLSANILSEFYGVKRRFELIGRLKNITIIDDYAHHPTEIDALFDTVCKMGYKRIWIIFQPHTFSRTYLLMQNFIDSLSKFDNVIIADIFASREINKYEISSEILGSKIKKCKFVGNFKSISDFIIKNAKSGDLILTVGAGNIDSCGHMILDLLKSEQK